MYDISGKGNDKNITIEFENRGYHIDKFNVDDFVNDNDRNLFIYIVESEMNTFNKCVGDLTKTINNRILEEII